MGECVFCEIVAGAAPSKKVLETANFIAIHNKFPVAPVHILVIPREHREKKETISGQHEGFWDEMLSVCWQVIQKFKLDQTGYKLVNNGAGYNHIEHEHMHILGGSEGEPGGET